MAVQTITPILKDRLLTFDNQSPTNHILVHTITPPAYILPGEMVIVEASNRENYHKSVQLVTRTVANGGNIELKNGARWWTGNDESDAAAKCYICLLWDGAYWQELYRSANYPA